MSAAISPFTIDVPQAALDDLNARLANTRWPEKEPVADWSQGIPLAYVQEVCAYWAGDYDWRATEARLNALPQFTTEIDGLDIHFIHIKSPVQNARPLIMTHGWPGSVIEFMKVIGPLSDPAAHGGSAEDAFDLVIPSLPGYGFSGKPTQAGWGVEKIADAWSTLMLRLGYDPYYAQGGDWGALVTTAIGVQDTQHCAGLHVNMPLAFPHGDLLENLTDFEKAALASQQFYQDWDSGYSKQQSTRPQTVGYGLVDSPAGQAAWILEKFYQWMDCDGHPENVLSKDELLDNIMLYWLTGAGASSARLYWESFGSTRAMEPVTVPSGASIFPKEIFRASKRWAGSRYTNLVHYNQLDKGGHFAAFEQPETFVNEVRTAFRAMQSP